MDKQRWMPINVCVTAVFLAVGAIWGSAWIPMQALSHSLPELLVGAVRFALATVVVGVAAAMVRMRRPAAQRRPLRPVWGPSLMLGATMLALPYALTAWAAVWVSPGVVAVCFALMPLGVLVFSREEGSVTAVVAGIGGVGMVVAPGISLAAQQLPGMAALLAAVGLGGFSLLYVRRLYVEGRLRTEDIPVVSAIQLGAAAVILLALLVLRGQRLVSPLHETAALPLTLLAVVVSGGTLPLLYWLLGRMPAWQVATLQWVTTLAAVAEAAVMVDARPVLEGWIGAVLIPVSLVWIFFRGEADAMSDVTPETTERTMTATNASKTQKDRE